MYLRLLLERFRATHTLDFQSDGCTLISCIDWAICVPAVFGLFELEYCGCPGFGVVLQHRQQAVLPELLQPF